MQYSPRSLITDVVEKSCAGNVAAQPAAGNVGDCGACASDNSRLNAWLEKHVQMPTPICPLGEGENEDQAAPSSPQTSPTVVASFERYESIDDIRPDSEPGIEMADPLGGDGQRVANFIRNAVDEITDIALGWQEQSWAMSWDEIFLDRQAEGGRIWDSKIATRWRARLAPSGQSPRGQTVSLRQIYMDKHAEFRDVDIVSAMNVVSGLKHPNISAIIGALLHQGDFYIVSEFCAEGSLQDLIVETHTQKSSIKGALGFSTMVTDKSVSWISGILQAVEYLHSIEVCHGKITASNVLVSGDRSSCKLCDCHINENLIQDIMVISPTSAGGFSDGTGKAADLFDVGLIAWQIGAGKLVECGWAEKPSQFKGVKKLEAAWVPLTELTVAGCKDKHMRRMFKLCSGLTGVCSATEALDKIVDGKVIKTDGQSTFATRYRVVSRLPGMGIISSSTSHASLQSETYANSVHGGEVPATLSREESVVSDAVETVVSGSSTRLVPAAEKRTLLMPPKSDSAGQLGKPAVVHVNHNAADLGVPCPSGVSPEFQNSQTILDQNGSSFLRPRSRFNTMSDASTFPTTGAQTFVRTPQTLVRSFSERSLSFKSRKSGTSPKVLGGRRCSNSGEWAPEDFNTQEVEDQESQASYREGKKRPPRMTALFKAFSISFSGKSATVQHS